MAEKTKIEKIKAETTKTGKSLVIVESPTKEKTITRFLQGAFTIRSSYGHVRDLPKGELGVDVEHGFTPKYVIIERAKRIISELNTLAKTADVIYLATDPDREGEAISWHLREVMNADKAKFKRISFHEITKTAIAASLKAPRELDQNMVNAQQARRVIDRLVGYKLSPLLWAKIKSGLSAGRVQSVAVRLIAERAKEIAAFTEEDYYTLAGMLTKGESKPFEAKLVRWQSKPVEQTITLKLFSEDYRYKTSVFKKMEDTVEAATLLRHSVLKVSKLETKVVRQKPKPPFITSTLQQDAYNKLGFSSERTMKVAQSLYEGVDMGGESAGLITYMRTDSFNVSVDMQKETAKFIGEFYGKEFVPATPPLYLKKVKGAQEAHEAIHPTGVARKPEDMGKFLTGEQAKLYDLIWRRFMASQMEDAVFDSVSVEFSDEKGAAVLRTSGRTVKFEGYLKVYIEEKEEDVDAESEEEAAIPPLKEGDIVTLKDMKTTAHKTSPPPNYNEASLIKTLEKNGIGRPSTYAAIIRNIVDRGYISKEKDRKLLITNLGALVTEKLKGFFHDIMEISYTASIEDKLDDVADGGVDWVKMMGEFYGPFSKMLAKAEKDMVVTRPNVIKTEEKCPLCLAPMDLRESRFGKYLSCSHFPKCKGKIPLDREGNKQEVFKPIKTEKICTKCKKSAMLLRKSVRGFFLACSGFPKCRSIEKVTPEEVEKLTGGAGKI
ncbi:MAG: DNA topoisomerase I [Elusimicrobia bacterium GWC2_51_8]|nr:MAG: DNA topoisomerase I [Elusimicrobia bacterium GWA2_51_34]OGR64921.1 MAG: DNA topoisomerase I [Elusimicrobia bacterium GWC2_51_8]OGR88503.1 MAG: DNA topoisomerase I [Elusimicrobia bacterium GWF2_52_66]HAF95885.1 type I DNA topoisomerase [Elusimicrobiota bacterium]HCE97996.1 type I DNA topoisomerase [Elusimicrobiota bacterium]